jgi:aryl-alcohol dehydrogenase
MGPLFELTERKIMTATTHVRAAVFESGSLHARVQTLALGELQDDEVLVRLTATGVCHTDLGYRNRLAQPVVLGHEGAGHVERVGRAVEKVKAGDPVVLSYRFCGHCPSCDAHKPSYCHSMTALNFSGLRPDGTSALSRDGEAVCAHFFSQSSFATHSVANQINVVKVRPDAPLDILGPLGCGVQTGAGAVMNVLKPKPGESLVVIGAGGVGMSALMAAVVEGCSPIIVIEPNAERRALAAQLGASHTIDPINEDVAAKLRGYTPKGLLHAIDTSGLPQAISPVLGVLGLRGSMALVTSTPRDAMLSLPILPAVARGITLRGVIEGDSISDVFVPKLVDLVMSGKFPLERLVKFYDLDHINDALEDQEAGRTIKPIIRM